MKSFVNNKADNTARPQSANSNRRLAAAQAKVQVPKANLHNEPIQMYAGPLRALGTGQPNPPPSTLQNSHRQQLDDHQHRRYDTDAGSSIDTTIHEHSTFNQGEDQRIQQRHSVQRNGHDGDEYSDEDQQSASEDGSDEDGESGGDDDQDDYHDQDQHQGQDHDEFIEEAKKEMKTQGLFHDEGNSYPSTTSGPPDEQCDQRGLRQQALVDHGDYDRPENPHLQPPAQGITTRYTLPTFQQARPLAAGPSNMPAPSVYQKGAAIRKSAQQASAPLEVLRGVARQTNAAAPNIIPSNGQTVPQALRQPKGAHEQQISVPAGPHPQHGAPLPSVKPFPPPTTQASVANPTPILALRSAPTQTQLLLKEDPAAPYRSIEEDAPNDTEGPIGDYDTPGLFNMDYDELRVEDFDCEPRRTARVLSTDMLNRDLNERLPYVQENLAPADQHQFFRSLPTREWEDAGDWFLARFGDIIKRAKEARQNKRKLARAFEDEVEKRYRKVAKRQQNVEAALGQMKEKGQGLIPKSPRASRAPPSKTPRSSKR
ncbi:hypothetical protein DPSP01_006042 [Paraphaeosphaeria sporulosa]